MPKYILNGKFLSQRMTGVQRYAYEIISALDKLVDPGLVELTVPPTNPLYDLRLDNIEVQVVGSRGGVLWEQLDFPSCVK